MRIAPKKKVVDLQRVGRLHSRVPEVVLALHIGLSQVAIQGAYYCIEAA